MSSVWTSAVLPAALTGGLAGAASSLLLPWSQWGVEKRRARRNDRAVLVAQWRALVAEHVGTLNTTYARDPRYLTLRRHLQPCVLAEVEADGEMITVLIGGIGGVDSNHRIGLLASEVDRLEREWHLS